MRTLLVASALALGACAGLGGDEDSSGQAVVGRVQPSDGIPTLIENGGVQMLQAYSGILDQVSPACVTAENVRTNAGAISQQASLAIVESREELKKEIGIDVNLAIKAPTASAKAALDILNSFQQQQNSVTLVFKIASSYRVDAVSPEVTLTDGALASLAGVASPALESEEPDAFIAKCGSGWISGVKFEARAVLVMQVTADTEETANDTKAEIAGEVNGVVTSGSASLGGKLSSVLKKNNVTTSSQLLLTGFTSDASPVNKDIDGTVKALAALEKDLNAAIEAAHEADVKKSGSNRAVVPVSFSVRGYLDATNAPKDKLRIVQDKLLKAQAWIQDNARFRAVLDDVYYGEILAYLPNDEGAGDDFARRAGFNLRRYQGDTTTKLPTQVAELDAIAARWKQQFDPDGRVAITARKKLDLAIEECLDEELTHQRYPIQCLDIGKEPAFGVAVEAIKTYEREGRILPLRHRMARDLASDDAADACKAMGKGWRAATFADLAVVAPALTAHDPSAAWIADPKAAQCADGQEAFLTNENGASEATVTCQAPAMMFSTTKPVVCVSGDGPHGKVTPLDLHYKPFRQ